MLLNHYLPKKNNTTVTHLEISFTLQNSEGNTSSKCLESPKLLSLPRLRVSLKTKVITTPTSCHFTNSAFLIVWLSWGSWVWRGGGWRVQGGRTRVSPSGGVSPATSPPAWTAGLVTWRRATPRSASPSSGCMLRSKKYQEIKILFLTMLTKVISLVSSQCYRCITLTSDRREDGFPHLCFCNA